MNESLLNIFTDGSYSSKTRRCGVGVAVGEPYESLSIAARLYDGCTHQHAELDAIDRALRLIDDNEKLHQLDSIIIWTDSDYSRLCLTRYILSWRKNGWLTSKKQPVKHKTLIENAARLLEKHANTSLRHISSVGLKAHGPRPKKRGRTGLQDIVRDGNERADQLASKGL